MNIPELQAQKQKVREVFSKANASLHSGHITKEQHDALLTHYYGTAKEHLVIEQIDTKIATLQAGNEERLLAEDKRSKIKAAVFVSVMLIIGFALYFLPGGPTGFVTLDVQNSTSFPINVSITGLNATGVLYGEGNASIYFDTQNGTYLVGTVQSDTGAPRTDKPSYAPGEQVFIEHAPNGTYYFDDGNATIPIDIPFNATANGTILIVPEGSMTTYHLPLIIGTAERATAFSDLCAETCVLNSTNGTLRIETTGTAVLQLQNLNAAVPAGNTPPELAVPFEPIALAEPIVIDLNMHFSDPDGDALEYAVGGNTQVEATLNGSMLTLTPLQPGTSSLTVYASDLQELMPATILVTVPGTDNATNMTVESISTNVTSNITTNITSNATNSTLDCSGTNPNLMPEECLLQNASEYFPDQSISWENLDRARVAKFTIIGNMLITGGVNEHATGEPGARDFRIGYPDRDGNTITTVWVDAQGNLNLRGTLHEENNNLQPSPGSYSLLTRRSIYLAYADIAAGDLYIRGNVIPYRRSLE